jgi:hypothetical protein
MNGKQKIKTNDNMKVELGISILSKVKTLLGVSIEQHRGVSVEDEGLCEERLVQLNIGLIFFIIQINFVKLGDKIETPDNIMKAMKAFEDQLSKENDSTNE